MGKISTAEVEKVIKQVDNTLESANKFKSHVFQDDVWYGTTATAASEEFESKVLKTFETAKTDLETLKSKIAKANDVINCYETWQRAKREYAEACKDGKIHPFLKSKESSAKYEYDKELNELKSGINSTSQLGIPH